MNAPNLSPAGYMALSKADDAVSRLEGRLTGSPLLHLWTERTDWLEAHAAAWNRGELAPLEDIILHDAFMDRTLPTIGVTLAQAILRGRRRAFRMAPARLLTPSGLEAVLSRGNIASDPGSEAVKAADRNPSRRVTGFDGALTACPLPDDLAQQSPAQALTYWLASSARLRQSHPPLLACAMLMDLWWRLEVAQTQDYAGMFLIEAYARTLGRMRHARLCLELGARTVQSQQVRWRKTAPDADRVEVCLEMIRTGAEKGLEELNRLSIADQILRRALRDRRRTSRMPELVELVLKTPLITTDLVAQTLRVTPQAAGKMIDALSGSLVEITGRVRYRAWRI